MEAWISDFSKHVKMKEPRLEKRLIKIVEKILHKELQIMLDDIRNNIKAGIFMTEDTPCQYIYKAEDVEKYFLEKLIEVDGYEN